MSKKYCIDNPCIECKYAHSFSFDGEYLKCNNTNVVNIENVCDHSTGKIIKVVGYDYCVSVRQKNCNGDYFEQKLSKIEKVISWFK